MTERFFEALFEFTKNQFQMLPEVMISFALLIVVVSMYMLASHHDKLNGED